MQNTKTQLKQPNFKKDLLHTSPTHMDGQTKKLASHYFLSKIVYFQSTILASLGCQNAAKAIETGLTR